MHNVRSYLDEYLGGSLKLFDYSVYSNSYTKENEEPKVVIRAFLDKGSPIVIINSVFQEIETAIEKYANKIIYKTSIPNI